MFVPMLAGGDMQMSTGVGTEHTLNEKKKIGKTICQLKC